MFTVLDIEKAIIVSTLMYIIEIFATLVATFFFYKYKHLPVKTVLLILWIAVITEAVARLYATYVYPNNHWVYNLYIFVFFGLFYKMVYDHIQHSTRRKIVAVLSILMMVGLVIRAITTPVMTKFMETTFTIATIVLIINIMYYAIDILKNNQKIDLKSNLQFFVFTAYLIFGITFIPLSYFLFGQTGDTYSERLFIIFRGIQTVAIICMHVILIVGFIWTQPASDAQEN